jgi:hypothetical protein
LYIYAPPQQVLDNDDDEYFERTDSKDVHMNRSREIVTIMSKISSNCEKKEATACCAKLLDIFSMYPDIKEHLVTHFGATPILEMFEATQSCPQTVCEGRTNGLQRRLDMSMTSFMICLPCLTSSILSYCLSLFLRDLPSLYSPCAADVTPRNTVYAVLLMYVLSRVRNTPYLLKMELFLLHRRTMIAVLIFITIPD